MSFYSVSVGYLIGDELFARKFAYIDLVINRRDIGVIFFMETQHFGVIHIADDIAVGKHDIVFSCPCDIVIYVFEGFEPAGIKRSAGSCAVRRINCKSAEFSRKIPFLAASEVAYERMVIVACDNADRRYSGVRHI